MLYTRLTRTYTHLFKCRQNTPSNKSRNSHHRSQKSRIRRQRVKCLKMHMKQRKTTATDDSCTSTESIRIMEQYLTDSDNASITALSKIHNVSNLPVPVNPFIPKETFYAKFLHQSMKILPSRKHQHLSQNVHLCVIVSLKL